MNYNAVCPNCGKTYCVMETTYNVDGIKKCCNCLDLSHETGPCFVQHIPDFVDGAEVKVYRFGNAKELFGKLHELEDGWIYVCNGNALMKQSLLESSWWVLGFINNFDMKDLGMPMVNYDIYNPDGSVNSGKVKEWLGCKMGGITNACSKNNYSNT